MGNDESKDYYRSLVRQFRMTELHALLSFAGQSRSGKKEILQERALNLVSLRSPSINLKIKKIFNTYRRSSSIPEDQLVALCGRGSDSYSNPYTSPIRDSSIPAINMLPTFPDVQLKPLPFYDIKDVLLKPCSLQNTSNARFQEQNFSFHLTPAQVDMVNQSSYRNSMGRPEYRCQVQMRFSLNETSCLQEDNFPQSISVKVCSRLCPLPPVIPTNKPGVDPKRPPKPINVTSLCKLSPTCTNQVTVSWAVEVGKAYTVSIYLVENVTFQDLLTRLKDKGEKPAEFTTALIKEKLRDQDQEIATTSCKVSLACPLGKMRMNIPCRSSTCDHLQTFDAALYLQMNEKKPKWKCPVCNKPALQQDLFIDGFFSQLVKSDRLPVDEHEIVLHNDGSWDPLPPRIEECESLMNTQPKSEETDCVPIDDSDSDRSQQNTPNPTSAVNGTASNGEVSSVNGVVTNGKSEAAVNDKKAGPSGKALAVKRPMEVLDCITLDSDSDDEVTQTSVQDYKRVKTSSSDPVPNQPPGSPDLIIIE